jgi:hypothetical protein
MQISPATRLTTTPKKDTKQVKIEMARLVATIPNEASALSGLFDGLNNSVLGFKFDLNL